MLRCLLLALLVGITLTACGGGDDEEETTTTRDPVHCRERPELCR